MNFLQTLPADTTAFDKTVLTAFAREYVAELVENGGDVLSLLAQAAKLELLAEELKEQAKKAALEEVRQYGKEGVSKGGVSMIVKESGVKYDYTIDPTWANLNATVVEATKARQQHETYLKALPYEGTTYTCDATGNMYRAYPPAKRAGETVFLEIK
ncbi:hypothetical protein A6C57_00455 [Fibrella sp. ES10-3-2-2]|nr:hypothetical protein A6C57_00455 [Fibrella sp. ES10-3-2-2]